MIFLFFNLYFMKKCNDCLVMCVHTFDHIDPGYIYDIILDLLFIVGEKSNLKNLSFKSTLFSNINFRFDNLFQNSFCFLIEKSYLQFLFEVPSVFQLKKIRFENSFQNPFYFLTKNSNLKFYFKIHSSFFI